MEKNTLEHTANALFAQAISETNECASTGSMMSS